ncbi:hypothetical protein [Hyalangium sp.]|uniref:SitA5 family polymorphic toxin n=1 Tax=Hyalangium sp. TaxID=2028555 RepID=UPI002D31561E|nr:hypothetical protein [Hyalangium sp.]HYH95327.1 hypothetical protein [Hyalangium sp.]
MTQRYAVATLLALLVSACSTPTKVVRLSMDHGAPIVHVARADVDPVELDDDGFEQALIEHGRNMQPFSAPLVEARRLLLGPSRHEPYAHVRSHLGLVSVETAPAAPRAHLLPEVNPAAAEFKRSYLQWCDRIWGEGDCLRLLVERPELDNDGKYTLAMAIAQRHVLGEMKEAFGEMVNPTAVYASITSAMTMYLLLWTLPEPISKGLAATLTVALMAYLGVDTVWRLIDGWLVLVREVDRATSFEEIEAAGVKYGKTMGRTAAKAFVMLATVAMANTAAGMASKLPLLPGAGQAAVMAETQFGVPYVAAAEAVAVVVSAEGATLALAPTAVAMAAREASAGGASGSFPTGYRAWGSFSGFKNALGPAGEGKEWHHIVEQTPGNVARFGPEALHNTENVIPLAKGLHTRLSALYSSIRYDITQSYTLTVRQWLSTQSFNAQREFGLLAMENVSKGFW